MFTFKKTFPYFVFTFKKTCPYCIGRVCFYLEEEEYQTANSSLVQRKLIYRCPDCKQPVELQIRRRLSQIPADFSQRDRLGQSWQIVLLRFALPGSTVVIAVRGMAGLFVDASRRRHTQKCTGGG